ncbi:hypothetical protein EQP59_02225 [Ornithobacterium rhinotracheale]|uniref:Uncharacterized protein n=1 Tax=Ornithobacterium rhinotracheale TaxID=28251 RepID=A0A3R5WYU1_ORNRH|nr:hypothetical protein [Ornithobacterium rhinotracheale]QAR30257.1 hypothetical protein EQP59_02225 [Ornithobacterium rhinotracheale]
MIQRIFPFNLMILLLFCFGCKNNNRACAEKEVLSKQDIYKKIEYFVNAYDFDDEQKQLEQFDIQHPIPEGGDVDENTKIQDSLLIERRIRGYDINDSLNFYFSMLIPEILFYDEDFRYLAGKLLEKRYLYHRRQFKRPKTFPVYNMTFATYNSSSNKFALNIVTRMKRNKSSGYKVYSRTGVDFVCIDSVVLELDKIPKMRNDSIHKICLDLVKSNETGNCVW